MAKRRSVRLNPGRRRTIEQELTNRLITQLTFYNTGRPPTPEKLRASLQRLAADDQYWNLLSKAVEARRARDYAFDRVCRHAKSLK